MKKLFGCLVVMLVMSTNAFSSVEISSSFTLDLSQIKGTETARELVVRLRKSLNTNFTKDSKDFTYNYLERYFQLYSNEPKKIFNKPVILNAKYDAKNKETYADVEVHFYKKNQNEVGTAIVHSKIKIIKTDDPHRVAFDFKSDYGWVTKQLINIYLSFGDGSRLIQNFARTTIVYDEKQPNQIKVELELIAYGGFVQESVIQKEVNYTKDVAIKFLSELRR